MPTIVWPGTPGDSFQNNTSKILYQVHCLWHNTCAACAQYDLVVVEWFSQLHRNCQCYIVPIMPGKTGAVYHDWRDTIAALPEAQQKELMGTSNWKLYQEGVVQWGDIVHETHILTLREVVSVKGLTVDQLIDAGIPRNIAEKAWESVNTPAHLLAEQNKQALVKKLLETGIQPKTLKQLFGDTMAKEVLKLTGPSGTWTLPGLKSTKQWVSQLLNELKGKISIAAKKTVDTLKGLVKKVGGPKTPAESKLAPEKTAAELAKEQKEAQAASQPLPIKFTIPPLTKDYVTVYVDVAKVDAGLIANNIQDRIIPGGSNQDRGRYDRALQYVQTHKTLNQPVMGLDSQTGLIVIDDGRHRFAALRDLGFTRIPVSVPKSLADRIQNMYGVGE